MARGKSKVTVNSFVGGLVTDRSGLNGAPNTTVDEDNCDLDRKGFRRRRLGLIDDSTGGNGIIPEANTQVWWVKCYEWESVGNDNDLNFVIVQWGPTLYFHDKSVEPLMTGEKNFIINLETYKAPGVTDVEVANYGVQVASGKGVLFIVGEKIKPLMVEYNSTTDNITVTTINIMVRDLEKQDTTTSLESRPSTLTNALKYDLYNQGWGYDEVVGNDSNRFGAVVTQNVIALDYYFFATDVYPPRTKPWWVGKRSAIDPGEIGFEIFDPNGTYDPVYAGNTLAPLGHFVLNAFAKDRSTASGITGFEVETVFDRPTAVAFFAGRVFYGFKNLVFFSRLITDDLSIVGDCYQEADPTAEEISDIVATDGGVITVHTSGKPLKFLVTDNSLLCFYDNGIWAISGDTPGSGFAATAFAVRVISSVSPLSSRTIVEGEDMISFWSDEGIYVLASDNQSTEAFSLTNILTDKIQDFYDDITHAGKLNASGAYDSVRKRMIWCYDSGDSVNDTTNRFFYNRILNFDVRKGAFFPYTISSTTDVTPAHFIMDVFNKDVSQLISSTELVTTGAGTVTDAAGNTFVTRNVYGNTAPILSDVKYLVRISNGLA
jgi:hypothetical protein